MIVFSKLNYAPWDDDDEERGKKALRKCFLKAFNFAKTRKGESFRGEHERTQ